MSWITIVLIWLIAPFAELGIIIGLVCENQKIKNRPCRTAAGTAGEQIPGLRNLEIRNSETGSPETGTWIERSTFYPEPKSLPEDEIKTESRPVRDEAVQPLRQFKKQVNRLQSDPGILSLIIGVVLVVLSGLVFATTRWAVLPDAGKVMLVFGAAGVFFAASFLADRIFHIGRTGNAFFILGSVFVFLTVTAAAYFRLLGPEFVLTGKNRWVVLWIGSLIFEISVLIRIGRIGFLAGSRHIGWRQAFFVERPPKTGPGVHFDMEEAGIASLAAVYFLACLWTKETVLQMLAASVWFTLLQLLACLKRTGDEPDESLSVIWEICGLATLAAGVLTTDGSREWLFGFLMVSGAYVLHFGGIKRFRKPACTAAMLLFAAAFWEQPFLVWPDVIALEMFLLPAAVLLALAEPVWGPGGAAGQIRTWGHLACLAVLGLDLLWTGLVEDALILGCVSLFAFILAQVKKDVLWVRISGGIILFIALFMTKEFWLSISWWCYLLAAGIGLIVFAAVSEKKKG